MDNLSGSARWCQEDKPQQIQQESVKKIIDPEVLKSLLIETMNRIDSVLDNLSNMQALIASKHLSDVNTHAYSIKKILKDLNSDKPFS